jgi:hypothetical protein
VVGARGHRTAGRLAQGEPSPAILLRVDDVNRRVRSPGSRQYYCNLTITRKPTVRTALTVATPSVFPPWRPRA